MDEYKSPDKLFCKSYHYQLIFTKLDIEEDSSNDEENFDIKNLNIEKLINCIQEAISYNNEDDIESTIYKLYKYLDNTDISSLSLLQFSNIIPILISQLARNVNNYLDKIRFNSIKCLHKIIFKSQILEDIAIKNEILTCIKIILLFPVCPSTEYALCILINIFSDRNELVPYLIDYFAPNLFFDLFKERETEKGEARLIALAFRKKIKSKICKLFLQYSTIVLKDEYYQSILNFFDYFIFQEDINDSSFYSVLIPIRGIVELFKTSKIDFNYLQNKSFNLFNTILNTLNFFQKLNGLNEMSELIESATWLIYLGGSCNEEQIKIFLQMILNSIQNEHKFFKINSFNFFNVIIEKKWIFDNDQFVFESAIVDLLCYSVENDSFEVECDAFSVLKNVIKIVDSNKIQFLIVDGVFHSIFKIIQTGDQSDVIDSISSFLLLYDKSQITGILDLFFDVLQKNENQINELFELEFNMEASSAEILGRFLEILNSLKQE